MLAPLKTFAVPGGFCFGASGARHTPRVAVMEGYCRLLWGLAPLASGGFAIDDEDFYLAILKEGITPGAPGYWGEPGDRDQRLVEMPAVALALAIARPVFWDTLTAVQKENLAQWLYFIFEKELPPNNWQGFRILVCIALRRLGLPVDDVSESASFDTVESCYRGSGWYQDGLDKNYDYYNPWAFHFFGLLSAGLVSEGIARNERISAQEAEAAVRYRERAALFAQKYIHWFNPGGEAIPFGRSLAYRFAAAAFWGACAFAGVEALPWGIMKGLYLRHLRSWFSKPIFDNAGVLSIGYEYPNLVMADLYNAPGSPYWAFMAFIPLALSASHPFWQAEELPLPALPPVVRDDTPGFIYSRPVVSGNKSDLQLFPASGFPLYDVNHFTEKYCKFVYSTRFGFCVSISPFNEEQLGCDSMLYFREPPGGPWLGRRGVTSRRFENNALVSEWSPCPGVTVLTAIEPQGIRHIRTYRITTDRAFETLEGGFPVRIEGPDVSRIEALENASSRTNDTVVPTPNLNIIYPRVTVPVLRGRIEAGTTVYVTTAAAGEAGLV